MRVLSFWPGGLLPYKSYIGMCRPKGYGLNLSRFGLKTDIDFDHYGLRERINVFVFSTPNE